MTTPGQDRYDLTNGGYVRFHYSVPAYRDGRIRFEWNGREGTITGFRGQHLLVLFDGDTEPEVLHPTWEITCLAGNPAAATPEQDRPDPVADAIEVVRQPHDFDCADAPYQPEVLAVARAAERLADEVERLRAALAHHVDTQLTPASSLPASPDRGGK